MERAHWLLSLYYAGRKRRSRLEARQLHHCLASRPHRKRSRWGEPKRATTMIAEGSVLLAANELLGAASDVAPDGFPHPVYRAGFAVTVPIPWRVAA